MKPEKARLNGAAAKKRLPKWKRHVNDYTADELARLRFASEDDIDAALEMVWVGQLQGVPFEFGGEVDSLIVPKVIMPYFVQAGLKFTHKKLAP